MKYFLIEWSRQVMEYYNTPDLLSTPSQRLMVGITWIVVFGILFALFCLWLWGEELFGWVKRLFHRGQKGRDRNE